MRNKVVDVDPFKLTYRPYHKVDREFYGEFDCLLDAVAFCNENFKKVHWEHKAISHTLKNEGEVKYVTNTHWVWDAERNRSKTIYEYAYAPASPWVILSERGVVTADDIKAARDAIPRGVSSYDRWEARGRRSDMLHVRLVRKRGDGLKIKTTYAYVWRAGWRGEAHLDTLVRGYHRYPDTNRERRINIAHMDEYGWGVVRGKRRKLPSSWDDRPCGAWDLQDSWKGHSKRRKQWKPK